MTASADAVLLLAQIATCAWLLSVGVAPLRRFESANTDTDTAVRVIRRKIGDAARARAAVRSLVDLGALLDARRSLADAAERCLGIGRMAASLGLFAALVRYAVHSSAPPGLRGLSQIATSSAAATAALTSFFVGVATATVAAELSRRTRAASARAAAALASIEAPPSTHAAV